ncbi:STAS domain-containing protein [Derxia lacustris]|uniref:STAS domain-containing protein n=1 Tax=Derxia lacustris TaxID=764842 RepID=UPI001F2E6953|nr:STAS domain-containing protein [Derxia lacustris]
MEELAHAEIARGIGALLADMPTVIDGELTIYRAAELRHYLASRLEAGDGHFDLSGVSEIDGAGVQLLLALDASLTAAGRQLQLSGVPQCVADALAACGLDTGLRAVPEYWA